MATGVRALVGLGSIGLLSRYFDLKEFGTYAFIMAYIAIYKGLARLGMQAIIVREVSKDKEKAEGFLAAGLLLQVCQVAIIWMAILAITVLWAESEKVLHMTYLFGLAMGFEVFARFFNAFVRAFERMEFEAFQIFIIEVVYLLSIVCTVLFDLGLVGVGLSLFISNVCGAFFSLWVVTTKFVRLRFKNNCGDWWYIFKEAYPIGIKVTLRKFNHRIDTLLISVLRNRKEVGLFHGPYKIVQSLTFVSENVAKAAFPVISRLFVTSRERFDMVCETMLKGIAFIGFFMAIGFNVFSGLIVDLVLGDKFAPGVAVLQILAFGISLIMLTRFLERILVVLNKQGFVTFAVVISLTLNGVLDLMLIPRYSFVGASYATLASEVALVALCFYAVSKSLETFRFLKAVVRPLLCAVCSMMACFFLKDLNVFVLFLIVSITYVLLNCAAKTFLKEEILIIVEMFFGKKKADRGEREVFVSR